MANVSPYRKCPSGKVWRKSHWKRNRAGLKQWVHGKCVVKRVSRKSPTKCSGGKVLRRGHYRGNTWVKAMCVKKRSSSAVSKAKKFKKGKCPSGKLWRKGHYRGNVWIKGSCINKRRSAARLQRLRSPFKSPKDWGLGELFKSPKQIVKKRKLKQD